MTAIDNKQRNTLWIGRKDGLINTFFSNKLLPLVSWLFVFAMPGAIVESQGQSYSHYFHHLSAENGLSQSTNAWAYQDSRGFVWISSVDGLNRFDGQHVKVYRPLMGEPRRILGQNIQSSFFEEDNGDLWFTTYEAINQYHRKTDDFTYVQLKNPVTGDTIREEYHAFYLDREANLWVLYGDISRSFIATYNIHTGKTQYIGETKANRGLAITGSSGKVEKVISWLYGVDSLFFLTTISGNPPYAASPLWKNKAMPLSVKTIMQKSGSEIWIGAATGLYSLDISKNQLVKYNFPNQTNYNVTGLGTAWGSCLLVSVNDQGDWIFDKQQQKFVSKLTESSYKNRFLLPDRVNEIHHFQDGSIWISSWGAGISYLNPHKKRFFNIPLGSLPLKNAGKDVFIKTICEDGKGNVWCGTRGAGLLIFNAEGKLMNHYPDFPGKDIFGLCRDLEGTLWVSTEQGIFRYIGHDKFQYIKGTKGSEHMVDFVFLYPIDQETIGAASVGMSVIKKVSDTWVYEPKSYIPAFSEKVITWFAFLPNGSMLVNADEKEAWLVTNHKPVRQLPLINANGAWTASSDSSDIWVSTTYGLGKLRLSDYHVTDFWDETKGLSNQNLSNVISDNVGNLWLPQSKGFTRFNLSDNQMRTYSPVDGLYEDEFYRYCSLRHSNGSIWVANLHGINLFRPEQINDLRVFAKPIITGLRINDLDWKDSGNVTEIRHLVLPYYQNTIAFDLSAMDFADPDHTLIRYKMQSRDANWLTIQKSGSVRYPKLPPGNYQLFIQAANSDGAWNPEQRIIDIRIDPPFWQTWWFRTILAFLIFSAAYALYRYRLSILKKEFALKQAVLESEKKALQSTITSLMAQLNPHFFFNSLNSINAFVMRNESAEASRYLEQFARLMRQILHYSTLQSIRLEQEIDFLRDYLEIESLRMKNRLTWDIEVEQDVDDFSIEVPPMILQPIVENAIWHGLNPKPEGGHIHLHFEKENNSLVCTITDNGVGRQSAIQKSKARHQSKGQGITTERLALYDQQHGAHSSLQIFDMKDEHGQPNGTQVQLRLGTK